jgi:hypothetical protein
MLFGPNNIDILAVLYCLTDERHILQAKNGKVSVSYIFFAENMHCLQVESPLSKDSPYQSSFLKEWLDFLKDLIFSVCWRTDDNYVSILHNIFGLV